MAHAVICKHCGQTFDRDKIPAVAVAGRRYVHKDCYDIYMATIGAEEQQLKELEEYIKQLFNTKTVSARIKKQIASFKKEYGFSYSGMLKTLIWWFDIRQNSLEKANNGIGIIPYVYKDAESYYHTIYLAEFANSIADMSTQNNKVIEIEIEAPQVERKIPRLFNLEG